MPKNNVDLGAGLLNLIMTMDLKDIKEEKSRAYCAIAGYNTGHSGVACAFVDKRDIPKAVETIHRMTPEQVFKQLRTMLAFEETRKYIVTVIDRIPL